MAAAAAAGISVGKANCISMVMNPKKSEKLGGIKQEVRFGLWEKNNPWPLPPLFVTKTNPNFKSSSSSHIGPLRATQISLVDFFNRLNSRQDTVPVIQVLFEDNNGVIWNELREKCEEFNSSNKSKLTSNLLLELMQLLLKHDKSSIHRKINLEHKFNYVAKNPWIYSCYQAELKLKVVRMIGRLFRLLKWGRNSSTVLIRVMTHIDNKDVRMEDFRNCLAEHETGDVDIDELFSKVCKGDKIGMHLSNTICLQPRVFVFALAEQDFGESPPDFVFEAIPS